jgi:hypothetical protein
MSNLNAAHTSRIEFISCDKYVRSLRRARRRSGDDQRTHLNSIDGEANRTPKLAESWVVKPHAVEAPDQPAGEINLEAMRHHATDVVHPEPCMLECKT